MESLRVVVSEPAGRPAAESAQRVRRFAEDAEHGPSSCGSNPHGKRAPRLCGAENGLAVSLSDGTPTKHADDSLHNQGVGINGPLRSRGELSDTRRPPVKK